MRVQSMTYAFAGVQAKSMRSFYGLILKMELRSSVSSVGLGRDLARKVIRRNWLPDRCYRVTVTLSNLERFCCYFELVSFFSDQTGMLCYQLFWVFLLELFYSFSNKLKITFKLPLSETLCNIIAKIQKKHLNYSFFIIYFFLITIIRNRDWSPHLNIQ